MAGPATRELTHKFGMVRPSSTRGSVVFWPPGMQLSWLRKVALWRKADTGCLSAISAAEPTLDIPDDGVPSRRLTYRRHGTLKHWSNIAHTRLHYVVD